MIEYGKSVCKNCLKQSYGWMYYIHQQNLVVKVSKNRLGDYSVTPLNEENCHIYMTEKPRKFRGLPDSISICVEKEGEKNLYTLRRDRRICPHCYEEGRITYLPSWAGYYDTYLIGILGRPGSGKSAWTDACIHGENLRKNPRLGANIIQYGSKKEEATPFGQRDDLVKTLSYKLGKKQIKILLVDTPGELETRHADNSATTDYEWHLSRVERCDGLLYMVDGETCNKSDVEWLSNLLLCKLPMCIVMTKSDLLKKKCIDGILKVNGEPIITDGYFENQNKMQTAGIYEKSKHMALDRHIIKKLSCVLSNIENNVDKDLGYFLISSGTDGSDKEGILFENGVNVYGPLEYILSKLKIYKF